MNEQEVDLRRVLSQSCAILPAHAKLNEIFRWRGYFFPIRKEIKILTFSMTIILANLSKHKHRVIQMILEHL